MAAAAPVQKSYTWEEVAKHNTDKDIWIVIDGGVYDVSKFLVLHPGGRQILLSVAGKDATEPFHSHHKLSVLTKYARLKIGTVTGPAPAKPGKKKAASTAQDRKYSPEAFGELIPYGDPSWYQDTVSPYYNDSHKRFRSAMREFVEREIMPFCYEWDEAKRMPAGIFKKCADAGWLPGVCGPPWNAKFYGDKIAGGVKPEEFDSFHELILIDEVARCGSGGVLWGLFAGLSIGLPPITLFGSDYLKEKVCKPCLSGDKVICLAITEPYAGSDVANLQCKATKSADGKHYIINGEKKWITNGVFADFFTVAVRTGGAGMGGISMILVERGMKGLSTRQMNCSGVWPSGTTFITFDNVEVPVENLIGKENEGFKYVMYNFNHERFGICVQAIRFARVCTEEALRYAFKRSTFGKKLIEHPVIRLKLAHMIRQVESSQNWLENITYQLTKLDKKQQNERLGGPIALLKAQATQTFEFCAREAAQIFGGLSYTRGGQGEKVERLYREVRAYAIPGGSEEIMLDLGVRQSIKNSKFASKL